jgi:hypothetical protein
MTTPKKTRAREAATAPEGRRDQLGLRDLVTQRNLARYVGNPELMLKENPKSGLRPPAPPLVKGSKPVKK